MELQSIDNTERDFPPEFCHYRDEGCEFASSCLNCPLPVCVYDEPGGRQRLLKRQRGRDMARMYTTEGKGIKELAEIFKVSQRTVQRALKKAFSEASKREVTGHE
jgi:hypothetical protein